MPELVSYNGYWIRLHRAISRELERSNSGERRAFYAFLPQPSECH